MCSEREPQKPQSRLRILYPAIPFFIGSRQGAIHLSSMYCRLIVGRPTIPHRFFKLIGYLCALTIRQRTPPNRLDITYLLRKLRLSAACKFKPTRYTLQRESSPLLSVNLFCVCVSVFQICCASFGV
jgi:hypothetical protein